MIKFLHQHWCIQKVQNISKIREKIYKMYIASLVSGQDKNSQKSFNNISKSYIRFAIQ